MAVQAPVEPLISVIAAPEHRPDVFTNENIPWTPGQGFRGIFGGFLLGHAVRAAQLSADASQAVHSLQATFVRPGQASPRFLYRVERAGDGRTFCTRVVRAEQGGRCVLVATIGLHRPPGPSSLPSGGGGGGGGGGGAAAAAPPPTSPDSSSSSSSGVKDLEDTIAPPPMDGLAPLDIPSTSSSALLALIGLQNPAVDSALHPFEWRHILPPPAAQRQTKRGKPSDFRLRSYVRSAAPLSADAATPAHHLAALAFLTDELLITTVNLAHPEEEEEEEEEEQPRQVEEGQKKRRRRRRSRFSVQTSLNHSVLFHDPAARADEWMVSERSTSWAADGRVLVEQRFWGKDSGRLVLSCWQEGLVRVNRSNL
ncbi:hypothetical protein RB593_004473 [Gaeumannomyces tritici]